MRIISSSNIDFVLPANFATELTRYNVLLSEAGEQTAPITLPPDPVNLKLIGYSNRMDAYYKPLTDLPVLVSDGLFHRWCNMGIHTADSVGGISCTLYFDSGSFYSLAEDKKLASLPWPIIKSPTYDIQTPEQRVAYLVALLKTEFYTPSAGQIFNVTQVLTSQDYNFHRLRPGSPPPGIVSDPVKIVLNGYELGSSRNGDVLPPLSPIGEIVPYHIQLATGQSLLGESSQEISEGEGTTTLPIGYGMTPFLKIKYMLPIIFGGYTVDTTAITAVYPEFDDLESLVNNVADAILAGQIKFSQLVPDCTIKEFIAHLEERYAGKFVIDDIYKTVTFVHLNVLSVAPDIDLTTYLASEPKIGAAKFQTLTVKYKSDKITGTEDDTDKQTTIELDFMDRKTFSFEKCFVNQARTVFYYPIFNMYLCDIGDIVHKNTSILKDGVIKTEDTKSSSNIQLITVDRWTNSFFYRMDNDTDPLAVKFYTAISHPEDADDSTNIPIHPYAKTYYAKYKDFLKNSNLPITATFDIPPTVLEKMNLQKPKLLRGQPVMLVSIKQQLGTKGKQTVEMRTIRNFSDRTPNP